MWFKCCKCSECWSGGHFRGFGVCVRFCMRLLRSFVRDLCATCVDFVRDFVRDLCATCAPFVRDLVRELCAEQMSRSASEQTRNEPRVTRMDLACFACFPGASEQAFAVATALTD